MKKPEFIVVAGCNAAGKSSFIRSRLDQLEDFEIIMTDVYKGRSKEVVKAAFAERKDVILETVFNDSSFKDLVDQAHDHGYETSLIVLFLDSPRQSLERVAARSLEQNGLAISGNNVKLNFNESFKNIALYYFYFDRSDFVYTGTAGENQLVMTFLKSQLAAYLPSELKYPQKFAEYAFGSERMNEEAYQYIQKNSDQSTEKQNRDRPKSRFRY